jgi:hypothetical protein
MAKLLRPRLEQVLALEENLARGMAGRGIGQQLQHRIGGDRLAGARLADQCHDLALGDIEGHMIDRHRGLAALMEGDRKIANGEERFGHERAFESS